MNAEVVSIIAHLRARGKTFRACDCDNGLCNDGRATLAASSSLPLLLRDCGEDEFVRKDARGRAARSLGIGKGGGGGGGA